MKKTIEKTGIPQQTENPSDVDLDRTVEYAQSEVHEISKQNGLTKLISTHPVVTNILLSIIGAVSVQKFTHKVELKSYIQENLNGLWEQIPDEIKVDLVDKIFDLVPVLDKINFQALANGAKWGIPLVLIGLVRGITIKPEKFIPMAKRKLLKNEVHKNIKQTLNLLEDDPQRLDDDIKIIFTSILNLIEYSVLGNKDKFLEFQDNLDHHPGFKSLVSSLVSRLRTLNQTHVSKSGKEKEINVMEDNLCADSLGDATFSEIYLLSEALKRHLYTTLHRKKSEKDVDNSDVNLQITFIDQIFSKVSIPSLEILEKGSSTLRKFQISLAVLAITANMPLHDYVLKFSSQVQDVIPQGLNDSMVWTSEKLDENGLLLLTGLVFSNLVSTVLRSVSSSYKRATDPIELAKLRLNSEWETNLTRT